jgi:hypothetical protein
VSLGSLDWKVSDVRFGEARRVVGEGEARTGLGSEKPVRADREQAGSGGASGNSARIDLNDSNRPVRTRMPGGVGGVAGVTWPPYPDCAQHGRDLGGGSPLVSRPLQAKRSATAQG